MTIYSHIENLLKYALQKDILTKRDVLFARNQLFDILGITGDDGVAESCVAPSTASEALTPILDYCVQNGIICEDTVTQRDLWDARIMGLLMPRPSEVQRKFSELYSKGQSCATDYMYSLMKNVNYIQTERIAKNVYWKAKTDFGELEITINLSKPEKDPREIAAAKQAVQSGYPKCLLCKENEGFAGTLNHPARQNLRLIPITLAEEEWYFQYSPYLYYNEHCIVLSGGHVPMKITQKTFQRLLDFVEYLPHYFIGSNADLPIVGGSILTHDHFQGGCHEFPMTGATAFAEIENIYGCSVRLLTWPLSVVRIANNEKDALIDAAVTIMESWRGYSDADADILAYSPDGTPHNAVTPIARINSGGEFELDLVLRNNRTTEEHPLGIFHPHSEYHHIKKENIGLIEVMGLAVLPGRLAAELEAGKYTTEEIGEVFTKVLENCGVFKQTEAGREQFVRFMRKIDIRPVQ